LKRRKRRDPNQIVYGGSVKMRRLSAALGPVKQSVDTRGVRSNTWPMANIIYPRSPRETMCGWMQLPRYIDKIRLHLADKLGEDYQPNFRKGIDGKWLESAGVGHEQFIGIVRDTITDGEVADWVHANVKKPDSAKAELRESVLDYPRAEDVVMQEKLVLRKKQSGLESREDIQCFVDYIDADEGRI
jgi:hypothetical protein